MDYQPQRLSNRFITALKWAGRGYRGNEYSPYAVATATYTGEYSDSPYNMASVKETLDPIKRALRRAGIPYRTITCKTSNIFCVLRQVIVRPIDLQKAQQLLTKH